MTRPTIGGIHHITAIAGSPQQNLDFYTEVLGLRLVKLTVNFDDPSTYHFYFGDATGRPGSILTFFPWTTAHQGRVGHGQVTAIAFAVAPSALPWWHERLLRAGVVCETPPARFGEPVLAFEDPDGLPLELVGTQPEASFQPPGTSIPDTHALRGFHGATLGIQSPDPTVRLLVDELAFVEAGREGARRRYRAVGAGPAPFIDVLALPDAPRGLLGTGTVHHIAWSVPNGQQQLAWRGELVTEGHHVSPVMDRTYFQSIYFREPGGVLFEMATDGPGFATDESPDHLGERLMLPPHVAASRAVIEQALPRLVLPHERPVA